MLRNIDDKQQWELEMELSQCIGWLIASRNSAAEAEECARKHREAEKEALAQISKVRQRFAIHLFKNQLRESLINIKPLRKFRCSPQDHFSSLGRNRNMLELTCQQNHQLVQFHILDITWTQMMQLGSSCLEQVSSFKSQAQNAEALLQVVFQKHRHDLLEDFPCHHQPIIDRAFFWVNESSSVFFALVVFPDSIVLVFSHIAFLLLVDGVATNTLAGFGVAYYKWEAV